MTTIEASERSLQMGAASLIQCIPYRSSFAQRTVAEATATPGHPDRGARSGRPVNRSDRLLTIGVILAFTGVTVAIVGHASLPRAAYAIPAGLLVMAALLCAGYEYVLQRRPPRPVKASPDVQRIVEPWLGSISERAQEEVKYLLNVVMGFADQQLSKGGEFLPFAVVINDDGRAHPVSAEPRALDDGSSIADALIATLGTLTRTDKAVVAAAVVDDVRSAERTGRAVRVHIEHRQGLALSIIRPYALRRLVIHIVRYGRAEVAHSGHQIWTRDV